MRSCPCLCLALLLLAMRGPDPLPDALEDAQQLRRDGQIEQAIALLEAALPAADGTYRDELSGVLGLCLLETGRQADADALAARHADSAGESYKLHVFLGRHAQLAGDDDRALGYLERAVELKEPPIEALVALIGVLRSQSQFQKGAGIAERLETYEPALGRHHGASLLEAAGDRLSQRAARRPEAMPRALELYSRALEKAPTNRAIALKLLTALLNTYRLDEAQALIDELFPQASQPVAWYYNTGRRARLAGDLPASEELLRKAVELEPAHRGASVELARLLLDRADHQEAGALLRAVDERHPDDAEILTLRGLLAETRGAYPGAERLLRRALAIDPDQSDALYHLGLVLMRLGKVEEAQTYLDRLP